MTVQSLPSLQLPSVSVPPLGPSSRQCLAVNASTVNLEGSQTFSSQSHTQFIKLICRSLPLQRWSKRDIR